MFRLPDFHLLSAAYDRVKCGYSELWLSVRAVAMIPANSGFVVRNTASTLRTARSVFLYVFACEFKIV